MKNPLYIVGHKNPDTDSICSAIAYAHLKNALNIEAIACCNGSLNPETTFVLNKFKIKSPLYMTSAMSTLADIETDEVICIDENTTLKQAWDYITSTKNKTLVVTDENKHLLGIVTMSSLAAGLMQEREQLCNLMSAATLNQLTQTLEGILMYEARHYQTNGIVHILVAGEHDDNFAFKDSIVVAGNDTALQKKAIQKGCSVLIIIENSPLYQSILNLAKENDCAIIITPLKAVTVSRLIFQAPPASLIMTTDTMNFNINDRIDEVSKRMSKTRYRSYPILDDNGCVVGGVSRYHLFNYQKKRFVLLDHNEVAQSLDNIEDGDIVEIIDHHRIGDIETLNPINFRNQTLGSTSTIIAQLYEEKQIIPEKDMAALMCCAIISDTMNFNSPTTTQTDRLTALRLADIAGLNLEQLSKEMFEAVATLRGKSFSEILYNDFKEYSMSSYKVAIGQINFVESLELEVLRCEFLSFMNKINSVNHYDLLLMTFTKVDGSGSYLLAVGKLAWIIPEAFKDHLHDHDFAASIISRKKQIVPAIKDEIALI